MVNMIVWPGATFSGPLEARPLPPTGVAMMRSSLDGKNDGSSVKRAVVFPDTSPTRVATPSLTT